MGHQRACITVRRLRRADRTTEIHPSLIEIPGAALREKLCRRGLDAPTTNRCQNVGSYPAKPRDNPRNITVHGSHRFTVGNGGNGRGRIVPNAGQLAEFRRGGRNLAMRLVQEPCRLVQMKNSPIVAHSFPVFEHRVSTEQLN